MPEHRFKGSVHPINEKTNYSDNSLVAFYDSINSWIAFSIKIENGLISIICNNIDGSASAQEIWSIARDQVRSVVDIVTLVTGQGYEVRLDTLVTDDGREFPVNFRAAWVSDVINKYDLISHIGDIERLIRSDSKIGWCLHDLSNAITNPYMSTVNCGRVIDGIRNIIAEPEKGNIAAQWEKLRTTLNIDKKYIQEVMDASAAPRHGERNPTGAAVSELAILRTWEILNRMILYALRGRVPLNRDEFPLLQG